MYVKMGESVKLCGVDFCLFDDNAAQVLLHLVPMAVAATGSCLMVIGLNLNGDCVADGGAVGWWCVFFGFLFCFSVHLKC